jgi:hypothetical protein
MKNRYGNEYHFEAVDANTFTIKGELSYWRFGGREGQPEMDFNDLGFVDPSGGPYISLGYVIEGRKVINIRSAGEDIFFQVESA